MLENILKVKNDIFISLGQTFYMVIISVIIGIILGTVIGLLLYSTSNPLFIRNKIVNKIVGVIINIIQSIPFLILMIMVLEK